MRPGAFVRMAFIAILTFGSCATLSLGSEILAQPPAAELPRVYVETTSAPPAGRTIAVQAGGNLQMALNQAQPGDMIALEAGATFTGPFTLPNKSGTGWINIRTSAPDNSLPPPGTRVAPQHASVMPKLVAASGSVLRTAPGAHHYRFIGIEIAPKEGVFLYNLVQLGMGENTIDDFPHHIIFDRCYLHGDPKKGTRRGIALNSRDAAVVDSYLSDFKEVGADSQAICGWAGPGPFKIVNNYLEGGAENVMFGGADPVIRDLVPSDIEIRRNRFAKPLTWRPDDPAYEGTRWSVKNLFELKNARRVLIEGNLFERTWTGFAILFTVRNQNGTAPWSVIEDVTFTNNVIRHAGGGINILGRDGTWPSGSQQTRRILISNNLFVELEMQKWGGTGRLFQLLVGTADVVIEHNTAFHDGPIIMAEGTPHTGFIYRNNLTPHNAYGIIGTDRGVGHSTLSTYFPGVVFTKNVLVGPWPSAGGAVVSQYSGYPSNFFPPSLDAVGFVNREHGSYRLAASSRYKNAATDGKDIGVDFDALTAATGR
jgi:hypothetical protein